MMPSGSHWRFTAASRSHTAEPKIASMSLGRSAKLRYAPSPAQGDNASSSGVERLDDRRAHIRIHRYGGCEHHVVGVEVRERAGVLGRPAQRAAELIEFGEQ